MHKLVIVHMDNLPGACSTLAEQIARAAKGAFETTQLAPFMPHEETEEAPAGAVAHPAVALKPRARLSQLLTTIKKLKASGDLSMIGLLDNTSDAPDLMLAAHVVGRACRLIALEPPAPTKLNRYLLTHARRLAVLDETHIEPVARLLDSGSHAPLWLPPLAREDSPEVDETRLKHVKRRIAFRKADRLLLCQGPLRDGSGHELLIEAVAQAQKRIPDLKLVCIGEGPRQAFLTSLAAALNVAGRVYFLPADADVEAALDLCELAICPHESGGWSPFRPLALGRGVALLRSRRDLAGETVHDEPDGWSVAPGSLSALQAALDEALEDEEQRRARASAARARQQALGLAAPLWLSRLLD